MEPLRWVLLLIGVGIIGWVFLYSRGLWPSQFRLPQNLLRRSSGEQQPNDSATTGVDLAETDEVSAGTDVDPVEPEPPKPSSKPSPLANDSKVITVRIMPSPDAFFPAEELILVLRDVGLRHGQFGIFHCMTEGDKGRVRYSVASLVEPGSFDLSNLKDSEYRGISIFTVLPAPENGVSLFDEMMETARAIAKRMAGRLVDSDGGAMSLQRERYMREELIEYLRRQQNSAAGQNLPPGR
jgi:cell division protein ZipA